MPIQTPAWYETKYSPQVMQLFQAQGYRLKNTVAAGDHTGGDKFRFRLAGRMTANERGNGKYTFNNAGRTAIEVAAKDYDAAEKLAESDLTRMGPNEIDAAAYAGAMACGRKADQIIIQQGLHALSDGALGTNLIGAFANDFTLAMALQVPEKFGDMDVPDDGNRFCAIPNRWWTILMGYEEFSSADYNGPDLPFVKGGNARSWNGVNWMAMSNFPERGFLPTSGAAIGGGDVRGVEAYGYAWHKDAIGVGLIGNGEVRSRLKEMPDEPTVVSVNTFSMAAVNIQNDGVIRIKAKTDSAIPSQAA
jgi:hypothetical protein